jgi:predicted ATPase/DNA-binding CsgD family transcriptional regulator
MAGRAGQQGQQGQSDNHHLIHLFERGNFTAATEEKGIHNLPAPVTSLVGREREVEAVCTLLRQEEVRLLTLTGTGGIGKTRLALRAARDLLDTFPDGVCFVPLAPIRDPALVIATIARSFGIKETGERPLLDLLETFLREKRLLLLLDNFEQVVEAAVVLSDLLAACPHLKILVTSRAVLRIQGEQEFPVPPLALPDLAHLPDGERLVQYPAIALFLQRARATRPDFAITQANARTIAEICARLDGLPLAIELAAVRIKHLPPQALLNRLEHRLEVLTGGTQDVPERQQTLRNTIAWSYYLLDSEQQRLFRRLSVFVGGSTLEAIESIDKTLDDEPLPVMEGLASLIDKSLLHQTEQEGEEPRFLMLETIREYGLEVLAASGEIERTHQAHALYYLSLAEQAEPELGGAQQTLWVERLEREHDNLRAAMRWSLGDEESARDVKSGGNIEIALRLGGALRRFWVVHNHISEGRSFLERALATGKVLVSSPARATKAVRAKALIAAANMAVIQSDYERTQILAAESLTLFRELEDQHGIALSLYLLGSAAWTRGNSTASRILTEEALAISRAIGDRERVAWSLFTLGMWHSRQGEYAKARTLFEESLAMHRELGIKRGTAYSLVQLAQVLFVTGQDVEVLSSLVEEGHALFKELGDREGIATALRLLGQVALVQGDVATARQYAVESVRLYREVSYRWGMVFALSTLAKVEAQQGNATAAWALYEESLTMAGEMGHKELIPSNLEGLASVLAAQGEPIRAARLWGAAEALREVIGVPVPPVEQADYEQAVASARVSCGEKAFTASWMEGRTMTPEQALAAHGEAIEFVSPPVAVISPVPGHPAGLTARELEVLRLVARGLTNTQIARELSLSEKTIAAHLTHIFNKTSSENRAAAVAFAIRNGLV